MRKMLFCLIAALMTTTAMAKGGPPTVRVEYDLGLFVIHKEVTPREAGQLFSQCKSKGVVDVLGIPVACSEMDMTANPGGARVIRFYVGLFF